MSVPSFPERLRALRTVRLLSQADLAELVDADQAEVSRWELGKRRPRPRTMRRLCAALGVEPATLLGNPFENKESI